MKNAPKTIIASLAIALLAAPALVGSAPAIAATSAVGEEDDSAGSKLYQGTIKCGENEDLAIFSNISSEAQRVTLSYAHGCSKGWLGATMVDESGASSWIDGCAILKKGITSTKATCTVSLPVGASIFLVQTEDYKESTGSGHTWEAQAR